MIYDILNQVGCRYVCTCCVRKLVCETAAAGFSSVVWGGVCPQHVSAIAALLVARIAYVNQVDCSPKELNHEAKCTSFDAAAAL